MPRLTPPLGCSADDIDTPYLHLDLDVMEENARFMLHACQEYGVEWRPHSKCHKSPEIAQMLVDVGAIGMTCAKLGEAEVMAEGGIRDLLIANMIVGPTKCQRLAQLAKIADPVVAVDHVDQLGPLHAALTESGTTVRVVLEIDLGMERVGVEAGEAALRLAHAVQRFPTLRLAGIMGYEGHLLLVPDRDEKHQRIHAALDRLAETRRCLLEAGIPCDIVSCGGTGSFVHTLQHPVVTEIQAGGAIFMDAYYRQKCGVENLGNALTIVTTVVSRPTSDRGVVDVGRKTVNMEFAMPCVMDREGIILARLSAEHGVLGIQGAGQSLRIGDRLHLIPGYADLTVNLHDDFYGFRQGRLERIIPIAARGHAW